MKFFIFTVIMILPLLGWSQENEEAIDFFKKPGKEIYGIRMVDINRMLANTEFISCKPYQNGEQRGNIIELKTPKGESLIMISDEYTTMPQAYITTYFEIKDGEKSLYIDFESRDRYPRLFEKLDKKTKEVCINN